MKVLKGLAVLVWIVVIFTNSQAQQKGKFTNHGPQLAASMIQGSIFVNDTQDNELLYTVVRGEPAHLLAYNIKSKKLILDIALANTDGVWDMAQTSDGVLYIPGAGGNLFKHIPGTQKVEDLGVALQGEAYLWNLIEGKDGEIFGATYPGCRVFRYHPKDGFSDLTGGSLVEGENYVRSLAFHHKTGLLYTGVGSHAHLLEINPKTGEKIEILPEKYRDKEFVYSLEIVQGKKNDADRLLILLTSGSITLIYNLKTKKVEQEIQGMDMKAIAIEPKSKAVFYTSKNRLMRFIPSESIENAKQIAENIGTAHAFNLGSDKNLNLLTSEGKLIQYNLKNKSITSTRLAVPSQPIPIQSIMVGPKGKIWTGGYLAGGHATFDPTTNIHTELPGLHQTEGMTVFDDNIIFGIYPNGQFYVFDTNKPWNLTQKNPKKIAEIPTQSRSFALLNVTEKKMGFFGMIPEYGKLGGALVSYNPATENVKTFYPIRDQAIASLVYNQRTLVGGTTISGGLGVKPSEKEAVLFGWDIEKGKKTFEIIPMPGAAAITCLINGPDGNIWGMADGVLFIFNPLNQKIISTHKLFDYPLFKSHIWRSAFLVIHPNGYIYGTDNNKLFKIDPVTKAFTQIAENASLLTMDKKGTLYFGRQTELWSYQTQ